MSYRENFDLIDWSGFTPSPKPIRATPKRSDLPAPQVIIDTMNPIRSHADGGIYDSKSAYYASVKAAGCEIVGNDKSWIENARPKEYVPEGVAQDVKRAIDELKAKSPKRRKRRV